MPSTWTALTSASLFNKARTFAPSRRSAASANDASESPARTTPADKPSDSRHAKPTRVIITIRDVGMTGLSGEIVKGQSRKNEVSSNSLFMVLLHIQRCEQLGNRPVAIRKGIQLDANLIQ